VTFADLVRDYGDIDGEVAACRTHAALFDFSFMSRGVVSGPGAFAAIQSLTPRPLSALRPGRVLYAMRVDERGLVRADLTVWQTGPEAFEVFSGRREDIAALPGGRDHSAETCILSVQGPRCLAALAQCSEPAALAALDYFEHAEVRIAGIACRVGRLGYTGERGFEIVAPAAAKAELWRWLAVVARCAGFAAADVLRIEAGFALFANDFRPGVTPIEAGLSRFTAADAQSPRVEFVGFTAQSRDRPVLFSPAPNLAFPPKEGEIAITSAAWSARAGRVVGLGYIGTAAAPDAAFIDPAGRFSEVRRARVPFVDPEKRRVRGGWGPDFLPSRSY
jgi:glycine cleavage system aminomethyltransferase T